MGGHYYAYIKNLEKGKAGNWYEFDDTSVSNLKESELGAAFGESNVKEERGRFSMVHSSATAYMLIYRQISEKNQVFILPEQIPHQIKQLMEKENDYFKRKQDEKKRKRESIDVHAFFQGTEQTFSFHQSTTLKAIKQEIAKGFGVADAYPDNCIRLRHYQAYNEVPVEPIEDQYLEKTLEDLRVFSSKSVLLEVKKKEEEFPVYNPQEVMLRVVKYDSRSHKFEPAVNVFLDRKTTLAELKELCKTKFGIPASEMRVVIESRTFGSTSKVLEGEAGSLIKDHYVAEAQKIYIEHCTDSSAESPASKSPFYISFLNMLFCFPNL